MLAPDELPSPLQYLQQPEQIAPLPHVCTAHIADPLFVLPAGRQAAADPGLSPVGREDVTRIQNQKVVAVDQPA